MRCWIVSILLMASCASPRLQGDIQKKEEERFNVLLRRNQELIENIRFYEARLDTLEKMHSGQMKGLYSVR